MNLRAAILVLAFAPLLFAPAGAQAAHGGALVDLGAEWAGSWNAKNLRAVMAFYAPDALFLPASGERWSGVAEIRHNFAQLLAQYDPHLNLHSVRSEASGNLAYDSGTFDEVVAPVKGGKAISAKGSYLFIFRRAKGGRWKILEQTWTTVGPVKL